jgi:catechol 2,3-dioxygenase-like lactoylglutathione lyase family enzyme
MSRRVHFILYVSDQAASTGFYSKVLEIDPRLNVPGMTEFEISSAAVLGLMPQKGVARLLGEPTYGGYGPKAELYLIVDEPSGFHSRALLAGAREISPLERRDWGHRVAYSIDPDGYIIAFAEESD